MNESLESPGMSHPEVSVPKPAVITCQERGGMEQIGQRLFKGEWTYRGSTIREQRLSGEGRMGAFHLWGQFSELSVTACSRVTCPMLLHLKTPPKTFCWPECSVGSPCMQHLAPNENCWARVERTSFSPAFPLWGSVQFQVHMEN